MNKPPEPQPCPHCGFMPELPTTYCRKCEKHYWEPASVWLDVLIALPIGLVCEFLTRF